jgi:hypothetical protein
VTGVEFSYAGLIVFLIMSMYLAGRSMYSGDHSVIRRVKRLLIPWAIWFVIYGANNLLSHASIIPMNNGIIEGILAGPNIHLWYMPFIFVCLTLFDVVRKYASSTSIAWASATLTALVLASTPVWRHSSMALGCPLPQYAHAVAGVLLGVFLAYVTGLPRKLGMFLLLIITAADLSVFHYEGIGIPYLIGIVVGCILAFRLLEKVIKIDVTALSECSLGIYLLHPLLVGIFQQHHLVSAMLMPVTVFSSAAFLIFMLRRFLPRLAKYCT